MKDKPRKKENVVQKEPPGQKESFTFRWATHTENHDEMYSGKTPHRSYRDPTADTAIGNVMREERRKKTRQEQTHRVGVWKSERSASCVNQK
jgi:hypothetical protein